VGSTGCRVLRHLRKRDMRCWSLQASSVNLDEGGRGGEIQDGEDMESAQECSNAANTTHATHASLFSRSSSSAALFTGAPVLRALSFCLSLLW